MFIKTLLQFQTGDAYIETSEGNNYAGSIDWDNLFGTLSFTLPYQALDDLTLAGAEGETETINKLRIKKNMFVKLYYAELSNNRDVPIDEMDLAFDGRVEEVLPAKTKTDITYTIKCEGTLSLGNQRPPITTVISTRIDTMPYVILQRTNLQAGANNPLSEDYQEDIIPEEDITMRVVSVADVVIKSPQGETAVELLQAFRDKTGVVLLQQMSGEVDVFSPADAMITERIEAWDFNTNENIFSIDYGDTTSDYDAVLVYGMGGIVGEAIDILKVQARGVPLDENGNYVCNVYRVERRDLTSEEDCQKIAREMLLEINKNHIITFQTKYLPDYKIGQPFTIVDDDMFSGSEMFFIKSIDWAIAKNQFDCTIKGFMNNLTTLPEDLTISATGVADVDYLGITTKVAGGDWQTFS